MLPSFCNSPDAVDMVNNDVQVEMAEGSPHAPIPWPWPTRWGLTGNELPHRTGGVQGEGVRFAGWDGAGTPGGIPGEKRSSCFSE